MRTAIQTDQAPAAIGPYSQGNRTEGARAMVFTAGQLGMDPRTGQLVTGGIGPECRRALDNLKAVLEAGGSGLDRVVKVTVFLQSMDEFAQMNEIYQSVFAPPYPARSAFAVAALPKGARVEIEAVALVD
jgi:2-iminobutanoate/2-iminopropanoate deaminase